MDNKFGDDSDGDVQDGLKPSVGAYARLAILIADHCDVSALGRLPFEDGLSNPDRVKRAREVADRVRAVS